MVEVLYFFIGELGRIAISSHTQAECPIRTPFAPIRILLLDDPHPDLPLAISLENRALQLGRAGLALARRLPHLTCTNYLPRLGQPQEWKGGRHRLDALGAATV